MDEFFLFVDASSGIFACVRGYINPVIDSIVLDEINK